MFSHLEPSELYGWMTSAQVAINLKMVIGWIMWKAYALLPSPAIIDIQLCESMLIALGDNSPG